MRRLLGICAVVVAPACAFLLDFDELQSDPAGGSDASTEGGACAESCDDQDPCTIDRCDEQAKPPTCAHDPAYLVDDGLDYSEEAKLAHRISLTASTDRFFASSFVSDGSSYDIRTYSFDAAASTVTSGPSFSQLNLGLTGMPVSALALATDKVAFPVRIEGYLAVGAGIGPSAAGRVYRLIFDESFALMGAPQATATSNNYVATSAVRAPSAWKVEGGPVWGAWVGPGGEVLVHPGQGSAEALSGSSGAVLAAPASGPNATGGAFYLSDSPKVQLSGMNIPAPLAGCNADPAVEYLSASTAYTGISNTWIVTWTKLTAAGIVTESQTFGCLSPTFCFDGMNCVEAPGVRNQVYALVRRNLDPPDILYEFLARPSVDLTAGAGVLTLAMVRARLGPADAGGGAEVVQSVELARYALGPNAEGPNWPAIALLGEDRLAVAWIEQHETESHKLRFRRFRACYPGD